MSSSVSRNPRRLNTSHEGGYYGSTEPEIVVPEPSYAAVLSAAGIRNTVGVIMSPEPPANSNIERDIPILLVLTGLALW
jgi:hypothetical protein